MTPKQYLGISPNKKYLSGTVKLLAVTGFWFVSLYTHTEYLFVFHFQYPCYLFDVYLMDYCILEKHRCNYTKYLLLVVWSTGKCVFFFAKFWHSFSWKVLSIFMVFLSLEKLYVFFCLSLKDRVLYK